MATASLAWAAPSSSGLSAGPRHDRFDAICDRIASLDAGADDCLVNPADSDEIAARLRALLRRPGPRTPPLLHVGALEFDVAARRLLYHEVELPLTHKEAELLELLMRRVGTVVRKSVITDALYGFDEEVTPNAVEASCRACVTRSVRRTATRCSIPFAAWDTCCARRPATAAPSHLLHPADATRRASSPSPLVGVPRWRNCFGFDLRFRHRERMKTNNPR